MNARKLIALLPPEKGEEILISRRQDTSDIIGEVLKAHQVFAADYDRISDQFAGDGAEKKLYNFCRDNLQYDIESEELQTTRSPAVLLGTGRCDCKGYAGFVAGVLDGLNRSGNGHYNWRYRFGNYEDSGEDPGHVFVVVNNDDGSETWIDPVLNEFDKRDPKPTSWIDKGRPMTLVRMSGVGRPGRRPPSVPVMPMSRILGPLCAYGMGGKKMSGFTADQLGIPIMQAVFQHWGNEYPGAPAALAQHPPVRFMVGNAQLPLPPAVTYGGQPVPAIPPGLYVQWDSSFMGLPIPSDMLNVQVNNGALQVWPLQVFSAGDTNNLLYNTNRYLLFLFLGVLENLIYSYSSWPWGNGFNDLSQQLNSARNYSNWLVYPGKNKKTFFGQVISDVASVQNILAPIEATVLNTFAPGSGALVAPVTNILSSATGASNSGAYVPVTGPAPGYSTSGGVITNTSSSAPSLSTPSITDTITQFAQANPIPTVGIAAAIALALYELLSD